VGFGDYLKGEKGERVKRIFSKPFHPTRLLVFLFSLLSTGL
jgi:hypothetical protein